MENIKPRILGLSTCKARRTHQLMTEDPLVQNLAQIGSLDPEYLGLMSLIERRVQHKDLPLMVIGYYARIQRCMYQKESDPAS